jgi:hypothetical protein
MQISNFELLIKRLAPGPASQLNRRVVQGYFLTLTNLETRPISIVVRVTTSSTGLAAPNIDRDLIPGQFGAGGFPAGTNGGLIFDNAPAAQDNVGLTLLDVSARVNIGLGITNTRVFQTPILSVAGLNSVPIIQAKQTVLLTLLPNVALITGAAANNLEIRGHVEIFQLFGNEPAKIMVAAEQRGTFLDNDFPTVAVGEQDFDQIAYPVMLSEGKSILTI